MLTLWKQANGRERANFALLAVFLLATSLFGGASRADVFSLPLAYLAAVLMIGAAVLQVGPGELSPVRAPLLMLAALAALMLLQLIPLPPELWRSLPGRAELARDLDALDLGRGWRPLSLTPDATLYALVALASPAAVLLLAPLTGRLRPALVVAVLLCCGLSALVGLFQAAGTVPSFYRVTNPGAAVGLFANRNHQATMLVIAFPLLAAWATWSHTDPSHRRARRWTAAGITTALLPLLLITGSRGGLLFGALAVVASAVLVWRATPAPRDRRPRRRGLLIAAGAVALSLPVAAAFLTGRDLALQRVAVGVGEEELRGRFFGLYFRIIGDHFPVGAGFGSFDPVFRGYEPRDALIQTYLNHAHNDPVELLIEGGLPAAALALLFAAWVMRRSVAAWRMRRGAGVVGQAASIILTALLLWSFLDYPLRTPTLAALAAVACALLPRWPEPGGAEPRLGTADTL